MSARQHVAAALCAAAAVVAFGGTASAQDVSGPNLKAAYIYNFALFTTWPEAVLPPERPITMCVVGDTVMRDALTRAVDGRTVDKRPITVVYGSADRPPASCHMLYMSSISTAQTARLLAGLGKAPVLTMSDLEGFNKMGGIAEFFYEAGNLRFSIRTDVVKDANLQLSSRLLRGARPIR